MPGRVYAKKSVVKTFVFVQAEGDVDAKLGNLHYSGLAVETRALLPGSPAINRGSPDGCLAVDQRGVARPQGGRCDIGAFEAPFYYLPLVTQQVAQ